MMASLQKAIRNIQTRGSMLAWRVSDSISNPYEVSVRNKLQLSETRVPTIGSPWDVLVKVHSTSVNPIDLKMVNGYGKKVLDVLDMLTNFEVRITKDRYPLTLGRDFSGEVVAAGPCAQSKFQPGDLVFGPVEPQRSGSHAEFVTVPSYCLAKKPQNLSHNEASSVPFVALTAYSALCTFGNLCRNSARGKQVLIIGGSGGVGSFAIQLLKLWGAQVTATCSGSKIEWLENELLVDQVVDHNDLSQMSLLSGRFDFILDCGNHDNVGKTRETIVDDYLKYLKPYSRSVFVTLSPPILNNTDQQGIILGSAQTAMDAIRDTFQGLLSLNSARWAVFLPNKNALDYVAQLLDEGAIVPEVSSVFEFGKLPDAFEALQSGTTRGKIVVDLSNFGVGRGSRQAQAETSTVTPIGVHSESETNPETVENK